MAQPENSSVAQSALVVQGLKTENGINPLGIGALHPRFRWLLKSNERAQGQRAYQVLVAGSLETLQANVGDKWDSGKVISDNSVEIPYNGGPLASGEKCYWKVRVWARRCPLPSCPST